MKRILLLIFGFTLVLSACGNKYEDEIDKVSSIEENHWNTQENETFKKFSKEKANFFVYEDGNVIAVTYNIVKDSDVETTDLFKLNETTGKYEEMDNVNPDEFQNNKKPDYELKNIK